jgi:putative oxidoreductase
MKAKALDRYAEFGPLFLRVVIGWHLVYASWGRVADHHQLMLFRNYLEHYRFPVPLFNAYLSAAAQVVCGYLYILGLFTRPAAAVMVINFVAALWMVHWHQPYPRKQLALIMLAMSIFLLLHGPGRVALDNVLRRRK